MSNENEVVDEFDPNWDEEDSSWDVDWRWDGGSSWIWGAILIIGGGVMLLQNIFHFQIFYNWWAVFILVPGMQLLGQAVRMNKERGMKGGDVQRKAIGGLFLTALALSFFLNVGFNVMGPAFLIVFGLFLLFSRK